LHGALPGFGTQAVVFDCDGVLVDSETLGWVAWRAELAERGYSLTADDVKAGTGVSRADTVAYMATRLPDACADELYRSFSERFEVLRDERLETFDDARATVTELERAGVLLGVASNSHRAHVDRCLELSGLGRHFTARAAADEVAKPKPEPDVYELAVARLGAVPERCIAVEDSPTGIASARAAGMYVVAVERGSFTRAELALADLVVQQLTPDLAAQLSPRR
jgi:HAD superfamily hydrolase (TIGR01509 family)